MLQPAMRFLMAPELVRAKRDPAAPGPRLLMPDLITEAAPGSDGAGNPKGPQLLLRAPWGLRLEDAWPRGGP